MKTTKKSPKTNVSVNVTQVVSPMQATQIFKDEVAKEKVESQRGCIEKFICIMSSLTNTKRSFTLADAYAEARPFELHHADIRYLWDKWCAVQQQLGRIEILENSCYDEPLVILV